MCASANAESVRIGISVGFRYRLQGELVKGLHGPVRHGRNAQRSHFPSFLWDVEPLEWLRGVSPPGEFTNRVEFCLWCQP